jgi:hypothetical protein
MWTDPVCGDGVCERPFEFPAYGPFGCFFDCGREEATVLIVVTIIVRSHIFLSLTAYLTNLRALTLLLRFEVDVC